MHLRTSLVGSCYGYSSHRAYLHSEGPGNFGIEDVRPLTVAVWCRQPDFFVTFGWWPTRLKTSASSRLRFSTGNRTSSSDSGGRQAMGQCHLLKAKYGD